MNNNVVFDFVDLEDSIVLGWSFKDQTLAIELEVALIQGHTKYTAPHSDHRACFIKGSLIFKNVTEISGLLQQDEVCPIGYDSENSDYDLIHCVWITEKGYYIEGEFGEVKLKSDYPVLKLLDTVA